jgi:hypothetical protein
MPDVADTTAPPCPLATLPVRTLRLQHPASVMLNRVTRCRIRQVNQRPVAVDKGLHVRGGSAADIEGRARA